MLYVLPIVRKTLFWAVAGGQHGRESGDKERVERQEGTLESSWKRKKMI